MDKYKSPIYSREDKSSIDVLYNHEVFGVIPFTCVKEENIALFEELEQGRYGDIQPHSEFMKLFVSKEEREEEE